MLLGRIQYVGKGYAYNKVQRQYRLVEHYRLVEQMDQGAFGWHLVVGSPGLVVGWPGLVVGGPGLLVGWSGLVVERSDSVVGSPGSVVEGLAWLLDALAWLLESLGSDVHRLSKRLAARSGTALDS